MDTATTWPNQTVDITDSGHLKQWTIHHTPHVTWTKQTYVAPPIRTVKISFGEFTVASKDDIHCFRCL